MKGKELVRLLRSRFGCEKVRQAGSHVRMQCGKCATTVPVHAGEDLKKGTLNGIEKDLEPCLGKDWLKR